MWCYLIRADRGRQGLFCVSIEQRVPNNEQLTHFTLNASTLTRSCFEVGSKLPIVCVTGVADRSG